MTYGDPGVDSESYRDGCSCSGQGPDRVHRSPAGYELHDIQTRQATNRERAVRSILAPVHAQGPWLAQTEHNCEHLRRLPCSYSSLDSGLLYASGNGYIVHMQSRHTTVRVHGESGLENGQWRRPGPSYRDLSLRPCLLAGEILVSPLLAAHLSRARRTALGVQKEP